MIKFLSIAMTAMILALSIIACSVKNEDEFSEPHLNEEQQNIADMVYTFDNLEINNIKIVLSTKQKDTIQSLLNIENWTKVEEIVARGFNDNFTLSGDGEKKAVLYDRTGILLHDGNKYFSEYILPAKTIDSLMEEVCSFVNESIKNGNVKLENDIYEFKELVIGKYEEPYNIPKESLLSLTKEEVASLLKVKEWKLYLGEYETVRNNDNVPCELHKNVDGMSMLLKIKQYGDLYIAKCNFYDGPGGQTIFLIPKETYAEILNFKNENIQQKDA